MADAQATALASPADLKAVVLFGMTVLVPSRGNLFPLVAVSQPLWSC